MEPNKSEKVTGQDEQDQAEIEPDGYIKDVEMENIIGGAAVTLTKPDSQLSSQDSLRPTNPSIIAILIG